MKNSPALYEERTNGPDATYRNPTTSSPNVFQNANFSGVTYAFTSRWFEVGRRYCPRVKMSTPAALQSRIAVSISKSVSPRPSMMEVFVTRFFGPVAFAKRSTSSDCA